MLFGLKIRMRTCASIQSSVKTSISTSLIFRSQKAAEYSWVISFVSWTRRLDILFTTDVLLCEVLTEG